MDGTTTLSPANQNPAITAADLFDNQTIQTFVKQPSSMRQGRRCTAMSLRHFEVDVTKPQHGQPTLNQCISTVERVGWVCILMRPRTRAGQIATRNNL